MERKNKDEYKDKDEIIASKPLLILLNSLLMLSFILLIHPPVHLIFGQEETSQTGQQGESSSSSKEQSKQQEKIRCSSGSIVDTPSECPLSDICPSTPRLGNSTPECNSNFTNNVSNSGETLLNEVGNQGQFQAIDIITDKSTYVPGEAVNITIRNTGTEPLTFQNAALGLRIENSKTHEKYPLFSAQVITTLDSGGKKSVNWDQMDSNGKNVRPGNYTATTSTGLLNANVTFAIS